MLKLVGLLAMLIDHIGYLLFPNIFIFRIIGRLAMPIFAYSIANGFIHSLNKNSISKYIKNLLLFSIVSQVPYSLFIDDKLNIGFTWLFSILLLWFLHKSEFRYYVLSLIMCVAICFIPLDYGLYGVLFPVVFYYATIKQNNFLMTSIGMASLFIGYIMIYGESGLIQIFAFLSVYIIISLKKYDGSFKINKWLYYIFYPAHIMALGLISKLF